MGSLILRIDSTAMLIDCQLPVMPRLANTLMTNCYMEFQVDRHWRSNAIELQNPKIPRQAALYKTNELTYVRAVDDALIWPIPTGDAAYRID